MNSDKNLYVLDELNKGCCMGRDALSVILEKISDDKFKKLVFDCLKKYDELSVKVNKIYDKYNHDEEDKIEETNTMAKAMTWYGIQIRTLADDSISKLSELTMQGLNMGIIDGRKLLNDNCDLDKAVLDLVNDYVNMQEKYVEKFKEYL